MCRIGGPVLLVSASAAAGYMGNIRSCRWSRGQRPLRNGRDQADQVLNTRQNGCPAGSAYTRKFSASGGSGR
jgi:hypothetical protein